jgi:large subunit ribosomal protein L31
LAEASEKLVRELAGRSAFAGKPTAAGMEARFQAFSPVRAAGVARPATTKEESLKSIHPELSLATVRCSSCGNSFATRSIRREIVVDVCSNCHPAYTGTERATRSGSRIERFERRRRLAVGS